jgi:hypothetical protein
MLDFGVFILSRLFYRSLSKFNRNDLFFNELKDKQHFFVVFSSLTSNLYQEFRKKVDHFYRILKH